MPDLTRLSGPGALGEPTETVLRPLPPEPLAELAAQYGLRPSAARPPFVTYLRQIWQRRHFILAFATARNIAMYTESSLGQVWQVLTPLLNAGVYYLIFGVIFDTKRGVQNFTGFLVAGVFIFGFTERSILTGSRVIGNNLSLIRALHFPRACLPLGYVIVELQQLLLSMLVLAAIVLATGEPITGYWLMLLPVLALQSMFNIGMGMIMARLGAQVRDISQLLPFLLRTWRYFCGVMYAVWTLSDRIPHLAKTVLAANPAAVYITLTRWSLMTSERTNDPGAKHYNAAKCALYNAKKIPQLGGYCRRYQRYVFTYGPLFGALMLAGLAGVARRWRKLGGAGLLPTATAVVLLVFPIAAADFDYRYLLPVLPFACLAAGLAFAPTSLISGAPVTSSGSTTDGTAPGSTGADPQERAGVA
jgi:teichoic acid transport system permease protein